MKLDSIRHQTKVIWISNISMDNIQEKPSHSYFYIKNMLTDKTLDFQVIRPARGGKTKIHQYLYILRQIHKIKPDIIYNPNGFYFLFLLRSLKLLNAKIICWKYTGTSHKNPIIAFLLKRLYWNGYDRIYMMSKTHVKQAITQGIFSPRQVIAMPWGGVIGLKKNSVSQNRRKYHSQSSRQVKTAGTTRPFAKPAYVQIHIVSS